MITTRGYSAFQLVFRPYPADLYGWDYQDDDLLFAQDASVSGQFAQQWRLRAMAQEAVLGEEASSKLRRRLARNITFDCTDVQIGDLVPSYKAPNRKS